MATRGQVIIQDGDNAEVVLYQHYDGDTLLDAVTRAIKREERWTDGSYLARIIFCEMMLTYKPEEIFGTTGFGIQTNRQGDTDFDIIVNIDDQIVNQITYSNNKSWSFEELSKL